MWVWRPVHACSRKIWIIQNSRSIPQERQNLLGCGVVESPLAWTTKSLVSPPTLVLWWENCNVPFSSDRFSYEKRTMIPFLDTAAQTITFWECNGRASSKCGFGYLKIASFICSQMHAGENGPYLWKIFSHHRIHLRQSSWAHRS